MEDTMMLLMDVQLGLIVNYFLISKGHVIQPMELMDGLIPVVNVLVGCHVFVGRVHLLNA